MCHEAFAFEISFFQEPRQSATVIQVKAKKYKKNLITILPKFKINQHITG
jgi:hypothetical protein